MERNATNPVSSPGDEMFQRVWNRVMPDAKDSPIVVGMIQNRLGGNGAQAAAPAQAPVTPAISVPAAPAMTAVPPMAAVTQMTAPTPAATTVPAAPSPSLTPGLFPFLREGFGMPAGLGTRVDLGALPTLPLGLGSTDMPRTLPAPATPMPEPLVEEVPVIMGMEPPENGAQAVPNGNGLAIRNGNGGVPVTPATPENSVQNDFPNGDAVSCLGSESLPFTGLLQEMIKKEIADWAYYRALAKRAGGAPSKVFSLMAAKELQHAKRLSAALFLISGFRYWPENTSKVNIPSYLSALRQRFLEEQQDASLYVAASSETIDPCLEQLFLEIAQSNGENAQQIRTLVEQA